VPSSRTEQYIQSFFVRTIVDWNLLADDIVNAPSADAFWNHLENVQSVYRSLCTHPRCVYTSFGPAA